MELRLGRIDGWNFTCTVVIDSRTGLDILETFSLRGRCPHGSQLLLDSKPPIAGECGCVPPADVLAYRDEQFAKWSAGVDKVFVS